MPISRKSRFMRGCLAFAAQASLLALAAAVPVRAAQDDASENSTYRSCQSPPDPPGLAAGLERRCPPTRSSSGIARGDFNGDGIADLAIGAPGEDLTGLDRVTVTDAGVVHVIYGSAASGLVASATGVPTTQLLRQPQVALTFGSEIAETGDQFGWSLAAGDFDGDGFSDLAVGVSQERVSGTTARGVVQVFRGSSSGLATTASATFGPQLFSEFANPQDSRGANSLTWGDFNGDKIGDLAVGSYGVDTAQSTPTYSRVTVLYGVAKSGLTTSGVQQLVGSNFIAAGTDELPTVLSAGDFNADGRFDLAIGSPLETLGSTLLAGVVTVVYGSASGLDGAGRQLWHANVANVPTTASQADRFGSAVATGTLNGDQFADLAIGIPGETVGTSSAAGAVVVLYGSGTGLQAPATGNVAQLWTQASSSVFGPAELNDGFGSALAAGDFDGNGVKDLAVGVPGEDLTAGSNAGTVNVIYGSSSGLSVTQGTSPIAIVQSSFGEPIEPGDQFGSTLSAWNFGRSAQADLAMGAPLEDIGTLVDAGAMFVIYGGTTGLKPATSTVQTWTQNSANVPDAAEAGDQFGKAAY
jgi:hypothetical protein